MAYNIIHVWNIRWEEGSGNFVSIMEMVGLYVILKINLSIRYKAWFSQSYSD